MNRLRKCTNCKERFEQDLDSWRKSPVGWFHDNECQIQYAIRERDKKRKKDKKLKRAEFNKVKKKVIQDRSWWVKKVQATFNKYIRERDCNESCITCGTAKPDIQYHAGHYLTTGARPEHRFNPLNCHKQCARCNNWLSGNVAQYRLFMVDKYGEDEVLNLESDHKAKKYGIESLKILDKWYKRKTKRLLR